jgi:RNA polymerase sigma-70 factor (sigma-E family)
LRTAFLLTGDRGHAEDLLQVALSRMARRWETIHTSPNGYAYALLVNLSRDRRRLLARRPRELPGPEFQAGVAPDPSSTVADRDAVVRAVRGLPRRQREVVVLRFFLDLSVVETAAALGFSEGAVKSHTSRALARLREMLEGGWGGPVDVQGEVQHAD